MLEKQDLFRAGEYGYHNCRIPTLVVSPGGALVATVEARRGHGGDYDDSDLCMRRSTDGGMTWGAPTVLASNADYGPGPMNNCSMVADRDTGALHALFCHDYARVFRCHSGDDGGSFSAPEEITGTFDEFRSDYPWTVCATGPGHGTQLRNGRLIVPVWLSEGTGAEFGAGHRGHRPSAVTLIYSDDHGKTWQRGEIVCRNADQVAGHEAIDPSETVMVERADGSVLFNMRNDGGYPRRLTAISPDGVANWSSFRWDEALLEPICMASMVRHSWPTPDGPGIILFANPDNLEKEFATWAYDRKRVSVKLSYDDGETWPVSRVLEDGPSGYSDLQVLPDGTVLCFYECGRVTDGGDDRSVRLARFDLDWLLRA